MSTINNQSDKHKSEEHLSTIDIVRGIGRKATDEELISYLNKDIDAQTIDLEIAFSKYQGKS